MSTVVVPETREEIVKAFERANSEWAHDGSEKRSLMKICAALTWGWLSAARAPAVAPDAALDHDFMVAQCRGLIASRFGKLGAIRHVMLTRNSSIKDAETWVERFCCDVQPVAAPAPEDGVQVRIAVAINPNGAWVAAGDRNWSDREAIEDLSEYVEVIDCRISFITAIVPRPLPPTEIAATVEEQKP